MPEKEVGFIKAGRTDRRQQRMGMGGSEEGVKYIRGRMRNSCSYFHAVCSVCNTSNITERERGRYNIVQLGIEEKVRERERKKRRVK